MSSAISAELSALSQSSTGRSMTLRVASKAVQPAIVVGGEAFGRVLESAARVAAADIDVLLLGETGTGKERLAQWIHASSRRRDRPLVRVDCGALVSGLFESELFGHARGAFTGAAQQRTGRVGLACGGTLLFDEIGDLPLDLQPKLLRLLQEREYEMVGEARTRRADIRVVAATNVDLKAAIAAGRFRTDLFHRLAGFVLRLPPLRERRDDIALLALHFLNLESEQIGRTFRGIDDRALEVLQQHSWPGNVRELRNAVRQACILARGDVLTRSDFAVEPTIAIAAAVTQPYLPQDATKRQMSSALRDVERAHIVATLAQCASIEGPNGAAGVLDLPPSTLRYRMRKLGIRTKTHTVPLPGTCSGISRSNLT